MKVRMAKLLAALTLLALLIPGALASGSFQAVVTSKSMKVYDQYEPHDYLGALPKGTEVTVQDYSGKWALISWNGRIGIAKVSNMKAVADSAAEAPAAQTAETATASELSGASKMVTTKSTKVYKKASTSSKSAKISAGVTLNVLSISGKWAKVERDGTVGYIKKQYLAEPETTVAQTPADDTVRYDNKPVMPTENCRVYAEPNTSSAYVTIEKGTKLSLQAVRNGCAMVTRNGVTGYIDASKLTDYVASESSAVSTAEITADAGDPDDIFSGTNEQIIFKFLTRVAKYNTAAACGILSNIKSESGFRPAALGDNGTSFGICQWHAGRWTRLMNWCNSNGYDHTTLKGQLYFLQYELKRYYPSVHSKISAVSNNAAGAYQAGYDFCYSFEAPANRETRAVTRGNYARDTMWKKYAV